MNTSCETCHLPTLSNSCSLDSIKLIPVVFIPSGLTILNLIAWMCAQLKPIMYILALVHHRSMGMLYEEAMFFCRVDEIFVMHCTLPCLAMFEVLRWGYVFWMNIRMETRMCWNKQGKKGSRHNVVITIGEKIQNRQQSSN